MNHVYTGLEGSLPERSRLEESLAGLSGSPDATVVAVLDADLAQTAVRIAEAVPNLVLAFIAEFGGEASRTDLPPNLRVSAAGGHRRVLEIAALPHRPHLIIEASASSTRGRRSAFPILFGTLQDGGHYVFQVHDRHAAQDAVDEAVAHPRWGAELGRSIGGLRTTPTGLIVIKRASHLVKLHGPEMERVCAARWGDDWSETLVRVPPGSFTPRSQNASAREIPIPERILRRHRDVTLSSQMFLTRENLVLAESFHHPHQVGLNHPRLKHLSRALARAPQASAKPTRELNGAHFLLDTNFPGHFGHITTEVLSMMWGWLELRRRGIAARPILSLPRQRNDLPAFQREIFAAFGIGSGDVEVIGRDESVRVPELYTASQQIESPGWIDPAIVDTWRVLEVHARRRAAALGVAGLGAERIFVSRRPGPKRNCTNTAQVERFFRRRGFRVYFPEDHDYLHQIETFARAERIAGFAGSGMFTMMFAPPRTTVLILASDAYSAANEKLIAAVKGNDITAIRGPSTVRPQQPGRHDPAAFLSDFTIDLRAHRETLRGFTSRERRGVRHSHAANHCRAGVDHCPSVHA